MGNKVIKLPILIQHVIKIVIFTHIIKGNK